jgi:hypothetical protein
MPEPQSVPTITLSPKQRFQRIRNAVSDHRAMLEVPAFERALDSAEAEYVHRLCELAPKDVDSSSNIGASAACFQRILGMHEFVSVLKKLSENPTVPKFVTQDNLQHKLK